MTAPVDQVRGGPIDYLMLDYLAEVTMSILQKQKQADSRLGYARDFPPLVARIAPHLRERGVRVIANAGGVNPLVCPATLTTGAFSTAAASPTNCCVCSTGSGCPVVPGAGGTSGPRLRLPSGMASTGLPGGAAFGNELSGGVPCP